MKICKIRKKIVSGFALTVLLLTVLLTGIGRASVVSAAELVTGASNTLSIHCVYEGKALENISVSVYRVADLDRSTGTFTPVDICASVLQAGDLGMLDTAENNAAVSADLVKSLDQTGIQADRTLVTGRTGYASAENLPDGIYLLRPMNTGTYTITPALVCVPERSEGIWQNGTEVDMKISANPDSNPPQSGEPSVSKNVHEIKHSSETKHVSEAKSVSVSKPTTFERIREAVKTGDNSYVFLYGAAMILACSLICLLLILRNRKLP